MNCEVVEEDHQRVIIGDDPDEVEKCDVEAVL